MLKTYNKKRDFIELLSMMDNNQINEYIKRHGSKPKPVNMVIFVDKTKDKKLKNNISDT